MQFAYKPGYATSVPTISETQKALISNDNGLEPTRGLRLEISDVRKTRFLNPTEKPWRIKNLANLASCLSQYEGNEHSFWPYANARPLAWRSTVLVAGSHDGETQPVGARIP
jgi:hypothetical protein